MSQNPRVNREKIRTVTINAEIPAKQSKKKLLKEIEQLKMHFYWKI